MSPFIVAAIDIPNIIGMCVLVISVLSWFVNVIQGKSPDGAPRAKPQKPKPKSSRSEIEVLLQQLTGEKPGPMPERREPPKPPNPQSPSGRGKNKAKPTAKKSGSSSASSRPLPRVSDTHLAGSNVGNEVRSHQMGNRVEASVQRDISANVQRDIQGAVQHDLGNRIAAALAPQEKTVHPLVKVLQDPNGIRQAVLLNEILQRPKALRR